MMSEQVTTATTAPARRRGPAALQTRGFRQLSVAWLFTNAADSALYLMVAVWVKELTGSDGAAAFVFVALGLPSLVAPFIGQLADSVSRKRLLSVANGLMAPVILSLLLVRDARDLWLIYAVTFVYGAMAYLTAAAQSGLVRDLLDDDELAGGNGFLTTIDQAFRLVSPLIGTALYVAAGPGAVVVLTTVCFGVTALLLARVEVVETPPEKTPGAGYWAELSGGLQHLVRTRPLGALTIALAVGMGSTGLLNVSIFPLMEQGLGVDPAMLGLLVSIQGVGSVIGGLTAARMVGRLSEARTIAAGTLVMLAGMTPFVLAGTLGLSTGVAVPAVVVGIAAVGLGVPWCVVGYVTVRQRMTPARLQGRVSAASNVALNLPQTLATMAGAAVIGVIDYRVLITATIGCLAATVLLSVRAGRRSTT